MLLIRKPMAYFLTLPTIPHFKRFLAGILICLCIFAGMNVLSARKAIISAKSSYRYTTMNEQCYLLAEHARLAGWDWRDLILLKTNLNDYWFPYYFMFLTGSEARTLDHFLYIANSQPRTQFLQRLKEKYRRIIIIVKEQLIPGMPFLVGKTEDIRLSEILPSTRIILLAPKEYDSFFSNVRSN